MPRPKGSPNKRSIRSVLGARKLGKRIEAALGPDLFEGDAHAFLMAVYKNTKWPMELRIEAARAAHLAAAPH